MSAYTSGAGAARAGQARDTNPYSVDSDKGKDWFRGYDAGRRMFGPSQQERDEKKGRWKK